MTVLTSSTLPSGSTYYIQNTNSLQSGAAFFVSSGTVNGPFFPLQVSIGTGNPNASIHISTSDNGTALRIDSASSANLPSTTILDIRAQNSTEDMQRKAKIDFENYATGAVSRLAFINGSGSRVFHIEFDSNTAGGFGASVNSTGTFKFYDGNNSNYTSLRSSDNVESDVAFVLPAADGTADQVLHTNGAGSWYFGNDDSGGSGASTLAVSSRTGAGSVTVVSSPTVAIVGNYPILVTLTGAATGEFSLDSTSVTLQGNNLSATFVTHSSIATTSYLPTSVAAATYQPLDATLTDLAAAPLGEADSISVDAIAAGTLPTDVLISSLPTVAAQTGQYTLATVTVDLYGRVVAVSSGTASGGGGGSSLAVTTGTIGGGFTGTATSSPTSVVMLSATHFRNTLSPGATAQIELATVTKSIGLYPSQAILTGAFVTATPSGLDASAASAQIDGGAAARSILFDATTDEAVYWPILLPPDWRSHGTTKVNYSLVSATTLEAEVEVALMCVTPGDAADIDTASFAAGVSAGGNTVPGTAGHTDQSTLTPTDDACAAGDIMYLYLSFDSNDATNDDATGDREVRWVEYQYGANP